MLQSARNKEGWKNQNYCASTETDKLIELGVLLIHLYTEKKFDYMATVVSVRRLIILPTNNHENSAEKGKLTKTC